MRVFRYSAVSISALIILQTAALAVTRLNPGTVRWENAALTGRADVLFLGDSIANFGSGGWSNGFAQAAMHGVGVAGSGVQLPTGEPGETQADYTGARIFSSGYVESASAGLPSLSPSGRHFQLSSNINFVGVGVDNVKPDLKRALDLHLFVSATTPNTSFGVNRASIVLNPYSATILQSLSARTIPQSISDQVFHFDAIQDNGNWDSLAPAALTGDAALYYTKVVLPTAKGVAVSGWGRGGATAQYFRDNYYNNTTRFTAGARTQYMKALVAGDSGLLNVAITFGVNDATQNVSTSTYETNIRGLVADVRRDWLAAGFDLQKLSFTLLSSYQVDSSNVTTAMFQRLNEYRGVLDGIAAGDSNISFVDAWSAGPTSAQAVASGYLTDALHPSPLGTQVYGQLLMNQLMPEIGDSNIDGHVNFDDLLALVRAYGRDGTWVNGDFDGSGRIDFDDLLKLQQHYNSSSFSSDYALAQSIAPEPAAAALLLALPGMIRRRR